MGFSARADFLTTGSATLSRVRQPRAVLFAAMPAFLALDQFTEGFVRLGLGGRRIVIAAPDDPPGTL